MVMNGGVNLEELRGASKGSLSGVCLTSGEEGVGLALILEPSWRVFADVTDAPFEYLALFPEVAEICHSVGDMYGVAGKDFFVDVRWGDEYVPPQGALFKSFLGEEH